LAVGTALPNATCPKPSRNAPATIGARTGFRTYSMSIAHLKPLIVSVKQARLLLGNISHQKFWQLAREGHFELLGTKAKRYVSMASIEGYVARMPRADTRGAQPQLPPHQSRRRRD
jgi:hypothetical protein